MQQSQKLVLRTVSVGLVAALAACGGGGSGKASQVAVKVNKDEITVLQVNEQLARLPAGITADKVEPATRQIIDSLVNQQLLVQQAVERKLDRDPQVVGAIEAARLNILARAYVQRFIDPQAKPSAQDVRKYYTDNPALFADRHVFRLAELSIEANADQAKAIEAAAAASKSLKQLADYLREHKIAFSADSGVRTAEQLPLARLPQIAQLKSGNILVFENAGRLSAIEVLASELQPVDDKRAAPAIESFLTNRKQQELATAEVKRLHDSATLEYVGEFAKYAANAVPSAAPAKPAADKSPESDKEKGIKSLQ